MMTGYWVAQMIHVAARLGIADYLAAGPKSTAELARLTGTHAESLYRMLRALAGAGIFQEQGPREFALTPLADLLRSEVPGSQRGLALMMGDEHYKAWAELMYSVRTGRPAYDLVVGKPVFEFMQEHPEKAADFDAAMLSIHGAETAAMIEAYDFSTVQVLADVGGGNGSTLAGVLAAHPKMRGVLIDLPAVIDRARSFLKKNPVSSRCQFVGADFFQSIPPGADTYMMRHIIHDWDDTRSHLILTHTRKAMPRGGKLLIVEHVIEAGNAPSFAKMLDVNMLVIPGGKERTADAYDRLLDEAGFVLTRIVPTNQGVSVIEAKTA